MDCSVEQDCKGTVSPGKSENLQRAAFLKKL